jgi:hypothetical protein
VAGDLDAQVPRDREVREPVPVLVDPEQRDRVRPVGGLAPREACVVGAEQEDVRGLPVLLVEDLVDAARESLVGRRDTVPELEVAREPPDDQEDEDDPERDRDPAEPPAARPDVETAAAPCIGLPSRLRQLRNLSSEPAAAVDPIGLLSGRHPAGYGSREG